MNKLNENQFERLLAPFLSGEDLANTQVTCKAWNSAGKSEKLWKDLLPSLEGHYGDYRAPLDPPILPIHHLPIEGSNKKRFQLQRAWQTANFTTQAYTFKEERQNDFSLFVASDNLTLFDGKDLILFEPVFFTVKNYRTGTVVQLQGQDELSGYPSMTMNSKHVFFPSKKGMLIRDCKTGDVVNPIEIEGLCTELRSSKLLDCNDQYLVCVNEDKNTVFVVDLETKNVIWTFTPVQGDTISRVKLHNNVIGIKCLHNICVANIAAKKCRYLNLDIHSLFNSVYFSSSKVIINKGIHTGIWVAEMHDFLNLPPLVKEGKKPPANDAESIEIEITDNKRILTGTFPAYIDGYDGDIGTIKNQLFGQFFVQTMQYKSIKNIKGPIKTGIAIHDTQTKKWVTKLVDSKILRIIGNERQLIAFMEDQKMIVLNFADPLLEFSPEVLVPIQGFKNPFYKNEPPKVLEKPVEPVIPAIVPQEQIDHKGHTEETPNTTLGNPAEPIENKGPLVETPKNITKSLMKRILKCAARIFQSLGKAIYDRILFSVNFVGRVLRLQQRNVQGT